MHVLVQNHLLVNFLCAKMQAENIAASCDELFCLFLCTHYAEGKSRHYNSIYVFSTHTDLLNYCMTRKDVPES